MVRLASQTLTNSPEPRYQATPRRPNRAKVSTKPGNWRLNRRSLELMLRSGWRRTGRAPRRRLPRGECFWRRGRVGLSGDRTRVNHRLKRVVGLGDTTQDWPCRIHPSAPEHQKGPIPRALFRLAAGCPPIVHRTLTGLADWHLRGRVTSARAAFHHPIRRRWRDTARRDRGPLRAPPAPRAAPNRIEPSIPYERVVAPEAAVHDAPEFHDSAITGAETSERNVPGNTGPRRRSAVWRNPRARRGSSRDRLRVPHAVTCDTDEWWYRSSPSRASGAPRPLRACRRRLHCGSEAVTTIRARLYRAWKPLPARNGHRTGCEVALTRGPSLGQRPSG